MLTGAIGQWSIRVLFLVVVSGLLIHLAAAVSKRPIWRRLSRTSMVVQFILASLASISLVCLLVTENFHYAYVAEYTGQGLPLIYRIAAFWGGNAGSLLLWVLVLTLYGAVVVYSKHEDSERLLPIVAFIMSAVTLFYTILLNTEANPFQYLPQAAQPNGLNPLLQNPGMTVHPVNVYLGYIGFTVTFAYAMAGLMLKRTDATWVKVTRRWTLVSWLFLSIGIVYGAHWSYEELGWGGYWAWDPVENASLFPWLTSTAFLHSAIVQEKRGMLKAWNIVLVTLTFLLTLLGTFLTRSGVLWSIHAFANAPLGSAFLTFLSIVLIISTGIIFWRWPVLKADRKIEAVVSKESGFMLNNVLFMGSMFAVLWGTVFPIISEAVIGRRMMVSGPFYNEVNLPLAVCIMVLMGIGPAIAWRRASIKSVVTTFLYPLVISILLGLGVAGILRYAYHRTSILGTFSFMAAAFVLLTVLVEFSRALHARVQLTGEHWSMSLVQLVIKNRRRYGGYVVHVAIAIMAIGIAGSGAYHVDLQQQLVPGQSAKIADYTVTFEGVGVTPESQSRQLYADLVVSRGSKILGVMRPSATFYNNGQEPSTNVALYSGPMRDLYIVMLGTADKSEAVFDMHVNPLVQFIWYGGYLFILGTLVSLWPERIRRGEFAASEHELMENSLYQDLAELEYDFRTGKLDVEEYEHGKQLLGQRLKNMGERTRNLRARLEHEIETELGTKGGGIA